MIFLFKCLYQLPKSLAYTHSSQFIIIYRKIYSENCYTDKIKLDHCIFKMDYNVYLQKMYSDSELSMVAQSCSTFSWCQEKKF